MAEGPVSRQELIRRRRDGGFVGRRRELAAFRENLAHGPGADTYQFLFHVHGLAGVGKSTLIRRWETTAREEGAVTAVVGDDVHSAVEAMAAISEQLGRQGCPLKSFDKQLSAYRQKCHEADTASAEQLMGEGGCGPAPTHRVGPSPSSTFAAQVGVAGLGLVPGFGAFSGAVRPEHVASGLDRARTALSSRLRSHEDVQLVLSPLKVLTPQFLADLGDVAGRRPWVVLFFDTYERTAPLFDVWLRDMLVSEAYGAVPVNVQAALAGQGPLNAACWGDSLDLVTDVALEPFSEDEARALLSARAVTDAGVVDVVLRLSGRLPVLLDALARSRPQQVDAVSDPSDTAVERFLKWETDPTRRDTILACALPLRVDEDIYRSLAPASAVDGFRWLRGLPFLTGQAGRHRYHDVIRAPILRVQRSRSPVQWRRSHAHLASVFGTWRREREGRLSPDGYWDDDAWRDHRLDETYHLLCAQGRDAVSEALHDTVRACGHSTESLRRWGQLFAQAGQDSDDTGGLARTGQHLLDFAGRASGEVDALTFLLATPGLGTEGRALAHALRGRRHRRDGLHGQALADYTAALALNPDLPRAYAGRGNTHQAMRRYEEALADHSQAIRLAPNSSTHLVNRASAYYSLRRYEEALADLDHALGLDRHDTWALEFRGLLHHHMGHHQESLTDFNDAITVDPWDAWAYAARGDVHLTLGRHQSALADLDHSLALEPHAPWPCCWRGETYRALGRYEEALADFDRAIELRPDCGWFPYQSALAMRLSGTPGEADQWQRAMDIYQAQARGVPGFADLARSNLLVLLCALPDWERAEEQLRTFLSHTPSRHQIVEALDDLADVQRAAPVSPDRLAPILGQLRDALGA
ncbi:tetratricopeptide repeat protein [Streptomyces sp. BA2]|uniref:tetratricopeptide repeat protein n=1 Tax=Streptomyces sp. BA2 TaxID=436595 RepID=UPI0013288B36|nr:tetratricopeptide repeat protein [Streptomyces sp. BA2]MWA15692.1 tetratricopeptide repeat protein [Streptomyces sp. BA2]